MSESPPIRESFSGSNTFSVSLPGGEHFHTQENENLLAAAQRAHWLIRFGCRNGNCEACAATLTAGRVLQRGDLIDAAQAPQKILLCLAQARSDLQIVLAENPQHGGFDQARHCYAQLRTLVELPSGEWSSAFHLPAGRQPSVYAGQRALIETPVPLAAEINTQAAAVKSARELVVISATRPELDVGARIYLRYPLGYAFHADATQPLCLLYETSGVNRARRLQSICPGAIAIDMSELSQPWPVVDQPLQIIALAESEHIIGEWCEKIVQAGIEFTEIRSDFGILKPLK